MVDRLLQFLNKPSGKLLTHSFTSKLVVMGGKGESVTPTIFLYSTTSKYPAALPQPSKMIRELSSVSGAASSAPRKTAAVRFERYSNAPFPMLVTDAGIVM